MLMLTQILQVVLNVFPFMEHIVLINKRQHQHNRNPGNSCVLSHAMMNSLANQFLSCQLYNNDHIQNTNCFLQFHFEEERGKERNCASTILVGCSRAVFLHWSQPIYTPWFNRNIMRDAMRFILRVKLKLPNMRARASKYTKKNIDISTCNP